MAALSLRGYWRTLSVRMAWNPAIRITRLTTSASTGRRMKRSVNDFMRLAVAGFRGRFDFRREFVVLDDARTIAKLEQTRTRHLVTRLQTTDHADKIPARAP